jgi:hypothetical protein
MNEQKTKQIGITLPRVNPYGAEHRKAWRRKEEGREEEKEEGGGEK